MRQKHLVPTPTLRAEEVGYFDPEYQAENFFKIDKRAPLVNAGKHVYYRDVYAFVDRLKDIASSRGKPAVRQVITACFRGSALMWYSMELDELGCVQIRADTDLQK